MKILSALVGLLSLQACTTAGEWQKKPRRHLSSLGWISLTQRNITPEQFSKLTLRQLFELAPEGLKLVKDYPNGTGRGQDPTISHIEVLFTGYYPQIDFKLHANPGDTYRGGFSSCSMDGDNIYRCSISDGEGGDNYYNIQKKNGDIFLQYISHNSRYYVTRLRPMDQLGRVTPGDGFACGADETRFFYVDLGGSGNFSPEDEELWMIMERLGIQYDDPQRIARLKEYINSNELQLNADFGARDLEEYRNLLIAQIDETNFEGCRREVDFSRVNSNIFKFTFEHAFKQ